MSAAPPEANPGKGNGKPEQAAPDVALHNRLIAAGAPELPAGSLYTAHCTTRGRSFELVVTISNGDGSEVHASAIRHHDNPHVGDFIELCNLTQRKAFPQDSIPASIRELLYGPQ